MRHCSSHVLPLAALLLVAPATLAQSTITPAPTPATQPTRESLLAEIAAFDLPALTYSGESIVRFNSAVRKYDAVQRRRLVTAIADLRKLDENAPELATLLLVRWRTLPTLAGKADENSPYRDIAIELGGRTPILQRAGALEQCHLTIERTEESLRKVQTLEYDSSLAALTNLTSRYPGDPGAAFLYRRRLEASPPGHQRDTLEQTFLTTYGQTPAAKQHAIQKYLEEGARPLPLPPEVSAETPKDKPVLIHFWSPTAQGGGHLPALKSLAEKFNNQISILCIPVGSTPQAVKTYCEKESIPFPQISPPDFPASQGISDTEVPLTYLLSPDGHLASIRYDTRFEKPLARLLNPAP